MIISEGLRMIREFGAKKLEKVKKRKEKSFLLDIFGIFLNNVFGDHGKRSMRF